MGESLSILLPELESSRWIYELGESIHSWFDLKLPGTTGKHESSMKLHFPGNPKGDCDCAGDGGSYSLDPQSWVTMDDSRPRSI